MNKVYLIGRTTKDIELRSTKSGKQVASFTLAIPKKGKDADFINCTAWDMTAQLLEKYVAKGDKVAVIGRLVSRSYEKDGEKRTVTEVVVDEIEFLTAKPKEPQEKISEDDYPF